MLREDLLVSCEGCGNNIKMHELRIDRSNKIWICKSCFDKKETDSQLRPINDVVRDARPKIAANKQKYMCTSCNYKFSRAKLENMCPYCSMQGTVMRDLTVSSLLREVK